MNRCALLVGLMFLAIGCDDGQGTEAIPMPPEMMGTGGTMSTPTPDATVEAPPPRVYPVCDHTNPAGQALLNAYRCGQLTRGPVVYKDGLICLICRGGGSAGTVMVEAHDCRPFEGGETVCVSDCNQCQMKPY